MSGLKIFRDSIQLVRQPFEELRKIASRVLKNRDEDLCKKNFTYSSVFKPYSNVLKIYSGVFLKKNFVSIRFRGLYSGVFKSYSDVLKPYSDVFPQFMGIESLKLDFHIDFFLTLNHFSFKSRLKNSSFIFELEFQTLEMLVFNIILKRDN